MDGWMDGWMDGMLGKCCLFDVSDLFLTCSDLFSIGASLNVLLT